MERHHISKAASQASAKLVQAQIRLGTVQSICSHPEATTKHQLRTLRGVSTYRAKSSCPDCQKTWTTRY